MIPIIGIQVSFLIKIAVLILLGMYLVFSWVIVRQIHLMTDTLQLGFEGLVKMLGFMHLIFAVFVFLTALFVL